MGNKIHQNPEPSQPESQLKQSRHQREGKRQADEVRGAGFRVRADGCKHQDGNGRCGAGNHMVRRTEKGGHNRCDHGGIQSVLQGKAGDHGKGHTLGQNDHRAGKPCEEICLQALRGYPAYPCQEWRRKAFSRRWHGQVESIPFMSGVTIALYVATTAVRPVSKFRSFVILSAEI